MRAAAPPVGDLAICELVVDGVQNDPGRVISPMPFNHTAPADIGLRVRH
jgi:hypothetical protein